MDRLLEIADLRTFFYTDFGVIRGVNGISFDIYRGRTLGLVGESGCGKSVTARSILGLIPPPGKIVSGKIIYHGTDGSSVDIARLELKGKQMRDIRGKVISMIFQEPMTCLSPVHTIGNQIMESIRLYEKGIKKKEARDRAISVLKRVGMPRPERHVDAYSFELSGGMRQRAMIAVALAGEPDLLIADEPTTAIDVTIQAKFMDLLKKLQAETSMAILLITHDLGVVSKISQDVVVMYLGEIVEKGLVGSIFDRPKHPYTQGLLNCIPRASYTPKVFLPTIEGSVPDSLHRPSGCPFSNRCPQFKMGACDQAMPSLIEVEENHSVACFLYSEEQREEITQEPAHGSSSG